MNGQFDKDEQKSGGKSGDGRCSNDGMCSNDDQKVRCIGHFMDNLPYPPPIPEPKKYFHKRELPSSLIQFSCREGKRLFQESLTFGMAHAFFPLSEQFLSQSEPAYCGLATLIMILNAMGIDPNVVWKGPWRWYGSEEMILKCCNIDAERIRRVGISMEEFCSLARCQGIRVDIKRPCAPSPDVDEHESNQCNSLGAFRRDIIASAKKPPEHKTDADGAFLVVSYSRKYLGQTGGGHFSPVAAYAEEADKCLVLDVARFKYPPYWVSVEELYESMRPEDAATKKSRGWFMMYPTTKNDK